MDGTFARPLPLDEVVPEYVAISDSGNAYDSYRHDAAVRDRTGGTRRLIVLGSSTPLKQ